jgi:hypothetical protein
MHVKKVLLIGLFALSMFVTSGGCERHERHDEWDRDRHSERERDRDYDRDRDDRESQEHREYERGE